MASTYTQAVIIIKNNSYDSKIILHMQDYEKLLLIHLMVMMVRLEESNSYNTINNNIFLLLCIIMKLFVTNNFKLFI